MSRRYIWIGAALLVFALLLLSALTNGPASSSTKPSGATHAATGTPQGPHGNAREPAHDAVPTPSAGRLAGPPVLTARHFMSVWLNRTPSAPVLRQQRPILVGLSTGSFAQLM